METPYITVTLEVSGTDEGALQALHDEFRDLLRVCRPRLTYVELSMAYQDQAQIDDDARMTDTLCTEDDT